MPHVHVLSPIETGRMPRWGSAVWAGLIAGVVFMMVEMPLVYLVGGMSPWAPMRMMGAILLGRDVLPPPATFDIGVAMAAMVVHFGLSIIYGLIGALLIFRLGTGIAILVGVVGGLLIYLINFYGFTALFPWFAEARNWMSIVSHMIFGAVGAWAYKGLAKRKIRGEERFA